MQGIFHEYREARREDLQSCELALKDVCVVWIEGQR
jgi:hypothetical protein